MGDLGEGKERGEWEYLAEGRRMPDRRNRCAAPGKRRVGASGVGPVERLGTGAQPLEPAAGGETSGQAQRENGLGRAEDELAQTEKGSDVVFFFLGTLV